MRDPILTRERDDDSLALLSRLLRVLDRPPRLELSWLLR